MLVDTPQIVWHGGEAGKNAPVLSLDSHPLPVRETRENPRDGLSFVLATAGTDAEVRLWLVRQPTEKEIGSLDQPELSGQLQSFVASLEGHQRGVNVVRFSPDGLSLASASDGGTVVIWSVTDVAAWSRLKSDREAHKAILRGATEDIYDLTWSPDSKYIACGSIDRRAHLWEVATKRSIATLEDHANYVQGTAWDPLSKYMATQSSDRSCRVYQISQRDQAECFGSSGHGRLNVKCCNVIKSCVVAVDDGGMGTDDSCAVAQDVVIQPTLGASASGTPLEANASSAKPGEIGLTGSDSEASVVRDNIDAGVGDVGRVGEEDASSAGTECAKDKSKPAQRKNLFVDETVTSFFRRLSWSPDGAFLITPTAQNWDPATRKSQFCTYLFARGQFVKPVVCLPGLNKPSVAVRCNPRLFTLKGSIGAETTEAPMCDLPYRAVFAVVSLDAVLVYDTEHSYPLTMATGLHYSGLTDVCWSSDGLSLFVSSTDGYVSKVHFKPGELGVTIPDSDVPMQTRRLHPVIYGWQPDAACADVPEVATASSSPSTTSNCGRTACEGYKPRAIPPAVEKTMAAASGEQITAAVADFLSVKPKKKITPTLVTPLLGTTTGATVGRRPPSADAGLWATSPAVMELSPAPGADDFPGDKKKRRIAPTLVHVGDVVVDSAKNADAGVVLGGTQRVPSPARADKNGAPQCPRSASNTEMESNQQDRTPKKKRLAPTLVSAL